MGQTKVLVIGLDGATFDVVTPAIERGLMPHLARLIEQGASGLLHSTVPAMSPPAWTSMITGMNPGKHGIYDFVRRQPGSYRLQTMRSDFYTYQTMFDYLSSLGRRVAAINIPLTYPPRPVNGVMVAGLGAPSQGQFTFPPELRDELLADGYAIDNTLEFQPGHERAFAEALIEAARRQVDWSIKLLQSQNWDLFMLVLRSIDEAQSFLWHFHDTQHPWYDAQKVTDEGDLLLDVHRQTDELIGRLLAAVDQNTVVLVVSDHGGGSLLKEVFLNNWLKQEGWLSLTHPGGVSRSLKHSLRKVGFTRERMSKHFTSPFMMKLRQRVPLSVQHAVIPGETMTLADAVDWPRTCAYSYGYVGQIFVNLKGREPQGIVDPGIEYEKLLDEITGKLFELRDPATNEKVVDHVFRASEIYSGPYQAHGADLNIIMKNMSYLSHSHREFAQTAIFSEPATNESGTHRPDGLFVLSGGDFTRIGKLRREIVDIAPTILWLLKEEIPSYVDGSVIDVAISEVALQTQPISRVEVNLESLSTTAGSWSNSADESEVMERLRALGYVE